LVELVIDTVVWLTLAKWETVSGHFGGYLTDHITAANKMIAELSLQRGIPVVDVNPTLSVDGVRRPEMTTDGIHFSAMACQAWITAVKTRLAPTNAASQ
jgi:lysophospholipase L1-like esterase